MAIGVRNLTFARRVFEEYGSMTRADPSPSSLSPTVPLFPFDWCGFTVSVLKETYGFEVEGGLFDGHNIHYWNTHDGNMYDLTASQFGGYPEVFVLKQPVAYRSWYAPDPILSMEIQLSSLDTCAKNYAISPDELQEIIERVTATKNA